VKWPDALKAYPTMAIADVRRMALLVAGTLVFAGISLRPADGRAQITKGGLNTNVTQTGNTWDITGGTKSGSNLFLSFGQFSVPANGTANFHNSLGLPKGDILGRVTGPDASTILGKINTVGFSPGTDLFLINPNGVVLGPNATLNVSGSFHVSTADYVRLSDQLRFYADPSRDANNDSVVSKLGPLFMSAPPDAFGFLKAAPAAISVKGVTLLDPNGHAPPAGTVLSVIGGETPFPGEPSPPPGEPAAGLKITGAGTTSTIQVTSGRVQVVSVAAPEVVTLTPNLDVSSVPSLGRIDVSNGARIVVDGNPGGSVVIRGGKLFVSGASLISASPKGTTSGAQPAIDVQVSGDIALSGSAGFQVISSISSGGQQAQAGDIRITAGNVQMDTGAFIASVVVGAAGGANVMGAKVMMVDAGRLTLSGGAKITTDTEAPLPFQFPSGPGGALTINASEVDIAGTGSGIFSTTGSTAKTGFGGAITITAPTVNLSDHATVTTTASRNSAGGNIEIDATNFSLTGGAVLGSSEGFNATSRGGNVNVNASGLVTLSGTGSHIFSVGSSSKTASAGDITVNAGTLMLQDSAAILNGGIKTEAGNITVTASDSIVIAGGAAIVSQANFKDVGQLVVTAPRLTMDDALIQASTVQQGNAGNITVTVTGDVVLTGGAQIATSSGKQAMGQGGNLTIQAGGSVSVVGRSPSGQPVSTILQSLGVDPADADASSGVFSTAGQFGKAGQINITTPSITLADGAKVSVTTSGTGQAGDIGLTVGTLALNGGASLDSGTTGAGPGGNITITASNAVNSSGGVVSSNTTAGGTGGSITIRTPQLQLTNATISATSAGTGDAGSILLGIGDTATLTNSSITTSARTADGGNILLTGGDLVYLFDSGLTTSVGTGTGKGGNITVDPEFVVLDHSQVRADAFGGPGGHIIIVSDFFLRNRTVLSASSALGTQGTVAIQSTVTNLSNGVAPLPSGLAQVATLLRASCAARVAAGKASSLVVAGREGVPLEPGEYIPSPLLVSEVGGGGPASGEVPDLEGLPRLSLSVFAPSCLR